MLGKGRTSKSLSPGPRTQTNPGVVLFPSSWITALSKHWSVLPPLQKCFRTQEGMSKKKCFLINSKKLFDIRAFIIYTK